MAKMGQSRQAFVQFPPAGCVADSPTPALTPFMSRFLRAWDAASDMLSSKESALEWMARPNLRLGGKAPHELCETEEGAAEVLALIVRLQHGVY